MRRGYYWQAMPSLAKLTRPKTHRAIPRESLFSLLDHARRYPLVWVVSPPGSGKTTLVSSYVENRKLRSLWYQLDAGDEDVATFFHYLTLAAQVRKRDGALPQFLPAHRANIDGFCRLYFRAMFSTATAPVLVVLDNYHELAAGAGLHTLLASVVAETPEDSTLVVISRGFPPPELAEVQVNGRMAVIGWDQLQMTLAETRVLAAGAGALDDAAVQRLHKVTGGWVAAVTLGVQRLGQTSSSRPDALGPGSSDMFDYFATQLLRQATPELREFLQKTSLLPVMTGRDADLLTSRAGSADLLEELHRRGLFTHRLGTRSPFYQYHDLFRAFLIGQLETAVPAAELAQLQRTAGTLLEDNGQRDHAIRLYVAVGDWDDARRALLRAAPELLAQGRSEALRDWARSLPSSHSDDPWMRYWLGAALARIDPPRAREELAAVWSVVAPGTDIDLRRLICADMILTFAFEYADFSPLDAWVDDMLALLQIEQPFSSVQTELHVHTACLHALSQRVPRPEPMRRSMDRISQLIDQEQIPPDLGAVAAGFLLVQHFSVGTLREGARVARRLTEIVARPGLSPLVLAVSSLQLGHFALRTGELEDARKYLERGLDIARAGLVNHPMLQVFSNLGLAFVALQRSDLAQAERHRKAIEEATVADRKTDRVALMRIQFWVACHRGQWDLALSLGERQVALARECGLFVIMFECHILLAYVLAQLRREADMEFQLAQVDALVGGTAYEAFRYQCDMARAYRALMDSDLHECRRWLERGLAGSRADEGRFMLRMQPLVFSRLLGAALRVGLDTGYVVQLIQDLRVSAPPERIEEWPWPIRIYTLGRFEVQRHGRPLEFSRKAPKKTLLLLKCIVAFGGRNVREQQLLDSLWVNEEGDAAARSLTAALYRLRALIGEADAVIQQGGMLSLDPALVWVDVWSLDEQLSQGEKLEAHRLLHLYRGSFLAEDESEPWSVTMRERLRGKFIHALAALTGRLEADEHFDIAIQCYLRGLDADPVIEQFYQGLMRCYARLDRSSEAIAAYRRLRQMLSVVLSIKPSPATERLYQSLKL